MFGASSWINVRAAEFIHCPSNCGSGLDFYRSFKMNEYALICVQGDIDRDNVEL